MRTKYNQPFAISLATLVMGCDAGGISTNYTPPPPTAEVQPTPPPEETVANTATPTWVATGTPTAAEPTPTPGPEESPSPTDVPATPTPTADSVRDVPGEYPSIQSAIDASRDGDLIRVGEGTWLENLDFKGKSVAVVAIGGSGTTRLDAAGRGSVVKVVAGEGPGTRISGFTIRGGTGDDDGSYTLGGGVVVRDAQLAIDNCHFMSNVAEYGAGIAAEDAILSLERVQFSDNGPALYGGGLSARNTALEVHNIDVWNNSAEEGGGAYLFDVTGYVRNSRWSQNTAGRSGGAIMARYTDEKLMIENNTLTANTAPGGAGIYFYQSDSAAIANIIIGCNEGPALELDNEEYVPVIEYNNVWDNAYGNYGGKLRNLTGESGNISKDPLFSNYSDDGNVFNDLLSLEPGSPCIDSGPPDASWNDPDGSRADMGMYGGPGADPNAYGDDDEDGMPDLWETIFGLDPTVDDSEEDLDADGLTNQDEYTTGTIANDPDTDDDGVSDGDEVAGGLDPLLPADNIPLADAGDDFYAEPHEVAELDGHKSWDPNGDTLLFEWRVEQVPAGSTLDQQDLVHPDQSRCQFTPDVDGGYVFGLRVSDGKVWSEVDQVTVVTSGTVYVPGPDTPTIQSGIDKALAGERVLVGPGTYNETLEFGGKPVRVESVGGPEVTIIKAPQRDNVAVFNDRETAETQLVGFTLTGGTGRYIDGTVRGGALLITAGTPTIDGCIFTRNGADDGGAIAVLGGGLTLRNSRIEYNIAGDDGGGIYLQTTTSSVIIERNIFRGNQGNTAGIYAYESEATIRNNIFSDNLAEAAGGNVIGVSNGTPGLIVANNLFVENLVAGAAIYLNSGEPVIYANVIGWTIGGTGLSIPFKVDSTTGQTTTIPAATPDFSWNDLYQNEGGEYGQAAVALENTNSNISVEPLFVDWQPGKDVMKANFYLMPRSALVDAGPGAAEWRDPDDTRNDIGVYGGPAADLSGLEDDDHDGMPTWWEDANGMDPQTADGTEDPDGDNLDNSGEYQWGSDPHEADTDMDGISDGNEVAAGTDPLTATDSRPAAVLVRSQLWTGPAAGVELDASLSYDPQGDPLTFAWKLVSAPPDSGVDESSWSSTSDRVVVFTPDVVGEYQVELVTTDNLASSEAVIAYVHVSVPVRVPEDYSSIQEAIDNTPVGGWVRVGPGTWHEDLHINKGVWVASAEGTSTTILAGTGLDAVVSIVNTGDKIAGIGGFTLSGGGGHLLEDETLGGGGLYLEETSALVDDLWIKGNSADVGGGVYVVGGGPAITRTTVEDNFATRSGGGITLRDSDAILQGIAVFANRAGQSGGVEIDGGNPWLSNMAVQENRASSGTGVGGLVGRNCGPQTRIHHSTFVANSGRTASTLWIEACGLLLSSNIFAYGTSGPGLVLSGSLSPRVEFSDVYGHEGGDWYGAWANSEGTAGNVSEDPGFNSWVGGDGNRDTFTLRDDSPCIDGGSDDPEYRDPDGSVGDMGAWGGPLSPMMSQLP